MLKITDTGAKVCGNGPHEMIRCIEYFTEFKFDRISCFQVENRMIGAIYTRTPIRSVWQPCGQTRTNKRIQVSKRKSGIMTNFHVLHSSSIIFSLYIFLCNRADIMQIDGMAQLRHPVAFFSFVWLLPSYCIIKNLVDSYQPMAVVVHMSSIYLLKRTYHSTIAKRPSLVCFLLSTRSDLLYICLLRR